MVPSEPLEAKQGCSGTEASDGLALVQDTHQSSLSCRIEPDLEDVRRSPVGVEKCSHSVGHLDGMVDEQGVDPWHCPPAWGDRAICAEAGKAGCGRESEACAESRSSRHSRVPPTGRLMGHCVRPLAGARYAATSASSASLISVLRKEGMNEMPRLTTSFTYSGLRSLR